MKLYFSPGACSLAPHIVALELGLSLDMVRVNLPTGRTEAGDDYRAVNPRGYVPALVLDEGDVLTEAAVLVAYLADLRPQAGLLPPQGTLERVKADMMNSAISTELHQKFLPLWRDDTPELSSKLALERLGARFVELNALFANSPYVLGQSFSAVDAHAFAILNWCSLLKIDLSAYPHIVAYLARVAARPNVAKALRAEGLLK
jgi:glutathione S-transferase